MYPYYFAEVRFSMDTNYRSGNGASRPPMPEDDETLFTDISYVPRTPVPPEKPKPSSPESSGRSEWSSPYGGRSYARAASGQDDRKTQRPNRAAPVYTEMTWDELRTGKRADEPAAPARPRQTSDDMPRPGQPRETPRRSATPYFGGFEQERDSMFNNNQPYHTPGSDNTTRREVRYVAPSRPASRQRNAQRTRSQQTDQQPQPSAAPQGRPSAASASRRRNTGTGSGTPPSGGRTRSSSGRRGGHIPPVYLMAGFVFLALIIFGISRLASGSSSNGVKPGNPIPAVTATPFSVDATEEPISAEATPEVEPDYTPTPSPEPSPTPAGPKAQKLGELIVPAEWGPVVPERRREVYDSYFDKSCMIGNSLVEGFLMWSGLTNLRYIYNTGATVGGAMGTLDLAPLTLNPNGYYSDVYLMFGLNEIGIDVNSFVQSYKKLVDFVREHQSTANIYIISVTPVTKRVDEDPNEPQKMERIRNFNAALKEFCEDQNCWYLDIYSMLLDKDGYLSADYAFLEDGKHFEKSGYVAWANYMKTHYVDSSLLTE